MLPGLWQRLLQRNQLYGGEPQRERAGDEGKKQRTQPPAAPRKAELNQEARTGADHRKEQRLRVTRGDVQHQGDDGHGDGASVRIPDEPVETQEQEREAATAALSSTGSGSRAGYFRGRIGILFSPSRRRLP